MGNLKICLAREEILIKQLNRGDFLFLDSAFDIEPGISGKALFNLSSELWIFNDHFPGNPLFPGSLTQEAMTQLGGLVCACRPGFERSTYYLARTRSFSQFAQLRPEDCMHIFVSTEIKPRGLVDVRGEVYSQKSELVAKGYFILVSEIEYVGTEKN